MILFREWLDRVLNSGESVQDGPPDLPEDEQQAVEDVLRAAHERNALDLAGPPVPFDKDAGIGAAVVLARACWLLASADESESAELELEVKPATPSAHFSTDLSLQFLPAVIRRARLRQPEGALVSGLERLLREWPLSGVLADLDGGPTTATDFGGHHGLQLLYAERLVETDRPDWVPATGPAREWVERVYYERGKPVPTQSRPEDGRA